MIWLQVIFFIITNAPTLIKAIRDLMDLFDGDKAIAKQVLKDMQEAKRKVPVGAGGQAVEDAYKNVINKYKSQRNQVQK